MVMSGRVQELLLDPVIFNFLNNDLEVDGSDLVTFTVVSQCKVLHRTEDTGVIQKFENLRPENTCNKFILSFKKRVTRRDVCSLHRSINS